jgi:superfamily I DNA and/or RNA helicase
MKNSNEDVLSKISKIEITKKKRLIVVTLTITLFSVSIFTAYMGGETEGGVQAVWLFISTIAEIFTVIITVILVYVWSIKKGYIRSKSEKNNNSPNSFVIPIVTGLITYFFIKIYLGGYIIDIPKGTHEGGMIAAIGVLVIMITMVILVFLVHWILKEMQNRNGE